MKPMKNKLFALLTAACLLSSCGNVDNNENIDEFAEPDEVVVKTGINIGTTGINGNFSPFFTVSPGDADVMSVINAPLVTLDRRGEVVRNAAVGEWRAFDGEEYYYEGISDVYINITEDFKTVLTFHLKDDVLFSDGEKLTADDLMFTLYVLCDADYKGNYGLSLLPVAGLDLYRTNTDEETYNKYVEIAAACLEAGKGYEGTSDDFDEEQYLLFYECYEEAWLSHVKEIVNYCVINYAEYADVIGESNLYTNEWMQVALAMMVWRVADFPEVHPATEERETVYGAFTSVLGRQWNLTNRFPTLWDFYREFHELYEGNLEAYINAEKIGIPQLDAPLEEAVRLFISKSAALDSGNRGADNIRGIRKTGEYEVEVTFEGHIPAVVYSFAIPVAPLHYYGNPALYNSRNNFGFERGNLSAIRENNYSPVGAGAYRLVEYKNGVAILEANEFYFKGAPETPISFMETSSDDLIYGVASGALDIVTVKAGREVLDEINAYSAAGINRQTADFGAFGYIGINAGRVNADGEPLSEESINFRKGFAVIFAAYREISIREFYGEAARIAEYPVSGVSWSAPRADDIGYRAAFGRTVNAMDIYTANMTEAQRLEAAKRAALGFFREAGCELNSSGTAINIFPDGIENRFEIYIAGYGEGWHPSYLLLTMATDMLRTMGFNIIITDVLSQGELYSAVMNGRADMFIAAWDGEIIPNMGSAFSSLGEDNFFGLSDEMLDQRIDLAETSLNLEFYRNALDAVLETAVIVPVYQREQYFLFSGALDADTIEKNLTTHYNRADILWQIKIGGLT